MKIIKIDNNLYQYTKEKEKEIRSEIEFFMNDLYINHISNSFYFNYSKWYIKEKNNDFIYTYKIITTHKKYNFKEIKQKSYRIINI